MLKIIKNNLLIVAFLLFGMLATPGTVNAQATPAGCPGGPAGPAAPGTVCPDGSTPVKDGSLPLGCPGSSQQGPPSAGYTASCPARPGRPACTFSASSGKCTTASGVDVSNGTATELPKEAKNDCNGPNIRSGAPVGDENHCAILDYIVIFINALAALAGVIMVGSLVFAGIQYAASADDPNIISAAKKRIRDTIIALAAFIFMYAFLQWVIPGGVL